MPDSELKASETSNQPLQGPPNKLATWTGRVAAPLLFVCLLVCIGLAVYLSEKVQDYYGQCEKLRIEGQRLYLDKRYSEAEDRYERAKQAAEHSGNTFQLCGVLTDLADVYIAENKLPMAASCLQRVCDLISAAEAKETNESATTNVVVAEQLIDAEHKLANTLTQEGKLFEAETVFQKLTKHVGATSDRAARKLVIGADYAKLLRKLGRDDQADRIETEAEVYSEPGETPAGDRLLQHAQELMQSNKMWQAMRVLQSACAIARKNNNDSLLMSSLKLLGVCQLIEGKMQPAELTFRELGALKEVSAMESSQRKAYLAVCLALENQLRDAELLYKQALAEDEASPSTAVWATDVYFMKAGQYQRAYDFIKFAINTETGIPGPLKLNILGSRKSSRSLILLLFLLAYDYDQQGKVQESQDTYDQLSKLTFRLNDNSHEAIILAGVLASELSHREKRKEAEALFGRAISLGIKSKNCTPADIATISIGAADNEAALNKNAKAETLYKLAFKMIDLNADWGGVPAVPNAVVNLGRVLTAQRKYSEADPYYVQGITMLKKLPTADGAAPLAEALRARANNCRLRGDYAQANLLCKRADELSESGKGLQKVQ
jgi:tetratricopeptide (TPR) repeat protein